MVRFYGIGKVLLAGALVASTVFIGACTKPPATGESSKLDEQRTAAESAEKKLAELRQERIKLEHDLQEKQAQLQKGKGELQSTSQDAAKSSAATPAVAPTPAAPVPGDTTNHAATPAQASPVVAPQAASVPADTAKAAAAAMDTLGTKPK